MPFLDRVIAAVTRPESESARREARAKARSAATTGDWLSQVLAHHLQIEDAFAYQAGIAPHGAFECGGIDTLPCTRERR
jgi:hypothetical protein